jgi:hypothetical protein
MEVDVCKEGRIDQQIQKHLYSSSANYVIRKNTYVGNLKFGKLGKEVPPFFF